MFDEKIQKKKKKKEKNKKFKKKAKRDNTARYTQIRNFGPCVHLILTDFRRFVGEPEDLVLARFYNHRI